MNNDNQPEFGHAPLCPKGFVPDSKLESANEEKRHYRQLFLAERERADALAAHVSECREALNWVFFHVPLGADAFAKLKPVIKAEAPTTSLDRRDALMRAEGGESALVQVAVEMRQNNERGSKADLYGLARHLEECARACRRQAEEIRS